jgi:hypothetical protein
MDGKKVIKKRHSKKSVCKITEGESMNIFIFFKVGVCSRLSY